MEDKIKCYIHRSNFEMSLKESFVREFHSKCVESQNQKALINLSTKIHQ
jgi:hypothetical protein